MSPRCRPVALALLVAAGCGFGPGRAAAAPSIAPLRWSAPTVINPTPPFVERARLTAVTCATSGLCVAVDDRGDALTTTDPTAQPATWTTQAVAATNFREVVCAGTSLCAAVGAAPELAGNGDSATVAVTTDPTAPVPGWTTARLARGGDFPTLQCPTSTQCLAVGTDGRTLVMSLGPGGQPRWRPGARISPTEHLRNGLSGLACPTTSLCLGLDAEGGAYTSTDAFTAHPHWSVRRHRFQPCPACQPETVACPTASLCLIDGGPAARSNAMLTTDPAARTPTWTAISGGASRGVFLEPCRSATLCVATAKEGFGTLSIDPSAPDPRFSFLGRGQTGNVEFSNCSADASVCVEVNGRGAQVLVTPTSPSAAWGPFQTIDRAGSTALRAIACPSAADCAALDDAGSELVTHHGAASAWQVTSDIGGRPQRCVHARCIPFQALSCPSTRFCVAAGLHGLMIHSHDAFAATPRWTGARRLVGRFDALSCASAHLCVVAGAHGQAFASTDPASSAPHWHGGQIALTSPRAPTITGLSCPSAILCVAVDGQGGVTISHRPGAFDDRRASTAPSSWHRTPLERDRAVGLSAVACPTTTLCVAADDFGDVLTTTDPAADRPHWVRRKVDGSIPHPERGVVSPIAAASVSCPSVHRCVVVEHDGDTVTTTDPGAARPGWSRPVSIDPDSGTTGVLGVLGVSCATDADCVAVTGLGQALGTVR